MFSGKKSNFKFQKSWNFGSNSLWEIGAFKFLMGNRRFFETTNSLWIIGAFKFLMGNRCFKIRMGNPRFFEITREAKCPDTPLKRRSEALLFEPLVLHVLRRSRVHQSLST